MKGNKQRKRLSKKKKHYRSLLHVYNDLLPMLEDLLFFQQNKRQEQRQLKTKVSHLYLKNVSITVTPVLLSNV